MGRVRRRALATIKSVQVNKNGAVVNKRQSSMHLIELSPWSEWGSCSATCGGGSRRRSRSCVQPSSSRRARLSSLWRSRRVKRQSESNACMQALEEEGSCSTEPCPEWTPWAEWSSCSATCGGGRRERSRECQKIGPGGRVLGCQGEPQQIE